MPQTPEDAFRHMVAFYLTAAVLDTGSDTLPNIAKIVNTPYANLANDADLKILVGIDKTLYLTHQDYLKNNGPQASAHLRHFVTYAMSADTTIWPGPEPHPKTSELAAVVVKLVP